MRFILIALCVFLISCESRIIETKPTISPIQRVAQNHLRGLYQVNDNIAWASGTKCTVLRTIDGQHWSNVSISDTADLDFRDIHAFNENEAVVLSAGNGVAIYRTADGGSSWRLVYSDSSALQFFDGMDFNQAGLGFAFGDPVEGKMQLLKSSDFGQTWIKVSQQNCPDLLAGEAGYAASGTGISVSDNAVRIVTGGGPTCRLIQSSIEKLNWQYNETPIASGNGAGIFSAAFLDSERIIAVGGNYIDSTNATSNCAVTANSGQYWELITTNNPRGYRSCVASNKAENLLLASGRTGTEFSEDGGLSWKAISEDGYYSISIFDTIGWAVGRNGKMARITL